jgi:hypothetical protein
MSALLPLLLLFLVPMLVPKKAQTEPLLEDSCWFGVMGSMASKNCTDFDSVILQKEFKKIEK